MLIARLEPENSIEEILDGVAKAKKVRKFLVIGKNETKFGEYLKAKFANMQHIIFVGGVYDQTKLNNLRSFSNIYFHGHTVGGTNPSLLEAMGSNALICANNNEFNSAILGTDALYFKNSSDVAHAIDTIHKKEYMTYIENNKRKIQDVYAWNKIINQYEMFFTDIVCKGNE